VTDRSICADCGTELEHGSCPNPQCPGVPVDRRVEVAREFVNPTPHDVPFPWDTDFHGEPDLSQPPPSCNGQPMRWVTRTVTYSRWEPVPADFDRQET